jgi:hypothetical protein
MSLLDYEARFSVIGDSMFDAPPHTQPATQHQSAYSDMETAMPKLNLDTNMQQAQGMPYQTDAIGDLFYNIQQAPPPPHSRNTSISSPAIMLGEQRLLDPLLPGQYEDRDFITRGPNMIYLQPLEELGQSSFHIELMNIVSLGYNVQRSAIRGPNMDGIHAMHIGIATMCQRSGGIPANEYVLLNFLQQQLAKIRDGTTPQIHDAGIDRPLLLEHLLMISHQYGLRNHEHLNIGVIRPSSFEPPQFGASATYTVSLVGPKTQGSKTIWLYEEQGKWFPLARNDFSVTTKSYADALKMPATTTNQRPITPLSSNTGLLLPGISPSTQNTAPSEAGTDMTGMTSLSCRSCGKKFEATSDLVHHSRTHRQRLLACPYLNCPRTFHYGKDLKRHEKTHSSKDTRMDFLCSVPSCGKAYTRQDNLRRHQRLDHPTLYPPLPKRGGSSVKSVGSRQG